jgi:hypothetical protein
MVEVWKDKIVGSMPEHEGFSGYSVTLVAISGVMAAILAVGELYQLSKTHDWTPVLVWLVEEMNKLIVRSSFRYKNVMRLLMRIMQLMGPKSSQKLLTTLSLLQHPSESLLAFAHLPSFPDLDRLIAGGKAQASNPANAKKTHRIMVCDIFFVCISFLLFF